MTRTITIKLDDGFILITDPEIISLGDLLFASELLRETAMRELQEILSEPEVSQ